MRLLVGGVAHLAKAIENDLNKRETNLHKPHIQALGDLASSVIACRNVNTSEWKTVLPRETGKEKSKERYISRVLSNPLIEPSKVIAGYLPDIIKSVNAINNQIIVLMLDQSKIADDFECLMVSMRFAGRAIPIAWKVVRTAGEIGFDVQKLLLQEVLKMLPEGVEVLLSADRFYGTAALIEFCQKANWQYRVRLKSNLILRDKQGGEITTGDAASMGVSELVDVQFNNSKVFTNIGIKSRGFSITKTNLKHEDRIERLILILTIALYWAVSTGMTPNNETVKYSKKNSIAL
jgi:hypothetical protein